MLLAILWDAVILQCFKPPCKDFRYGSIMCSRRVKGVLGDVWDAVHIIASISPPLEIRLNDEFLKIYIF